MSKAAPKHVFKLPGIAENRRITEAARRDPDAQPLTPSQLKAMVPIKSILGRPKLENKKVLVSVRYSPHVLAFFRSTGDGWQSRMDGVLRDYVDKQTAKAGRRN